MNKPETSIDQLRSIHVLQNPIQPYAWGSLTAANPHELMRAMEVINLIDLGELVFITARERKETRGKHIRPDYPFTNPMMAKLLVVKKVEGEPVLEWRETRKK